MPRLTSVAIGLTLPLLALAGCSSTELSTGPGGPVTTRGTQVQGTILVNDEAGESAAAGIGAGIVATPPNTDPNAPSTTTTTIFGSPPPPPSVTTTRPGGGPPPTDPVTTPPTNPTVTTARPTTTLPTKPAPIPINYSGDQAAIQQAINNSRGGGHEVTAEQHATDAAQAQSVTMVQNNSPSGINDIFAAVNAQYRFLAQLEINGPAGPGITPIANSIVSNYGSTINDPALVYIGVGVKKSPTNIYYVTVILGY